MAEEISIKDAMEILGVSKPTIYRLIRDGELHPIRKKIGLGVGGRRVWLDGKEVEALRTPPARPPVTPKSKPAKRGGK